SAVPSQRQDHLLIFEDAAFKIVDAPFRVHVRIGGDRVVSFDPYFHVPPSYARRMRNLRSFNATIAGLANAAFYAIFALAETVGLRHLLRTRSLNVSFALSASAVLVTVHYAATLNHLEMLWFAKSSSVSSRSHLQSLVVTLASSALTTGLSVSVAALTADGMTRRAFPHLPSLSHALSVSALPPRAVRQQILLSTLLVPMMLAYDSLFYKFTTSYLDFWIPSSPSTDPNILGSTFPALSSIAAAASAGFIEECLFRAVPIAGGALLGRRLKRESLFVSVGFALQAVVFSAAHANYPALPGYARVLELLPPSIVFGWLFLRFGLLPGILLHFYYDLILMALPVLSVDPRVFWVSQLVICATIALPFTYCLIAPRLFKSGERRLILYHDLEPAALDVLAFLRLPAWIPPRLPAFDTRLRRAAVLGLVGGALLLALPNPNQQRFASVSRADVLDAAARLRRALNLTHMDPPHPGAEVDSEPFWYTRASLGAGEVVEKGYVYDAGLAATDVPGRLYGEPFFATPRWR
ncbi:hypothetical protein HK405_015713, partial [Cladochytrium tenue]